MSSRIYVFAILRLIRLDGETFQVFIVRHIFLYGISYDLRSLYAELLDPLS